MKKRMHPTSFMEINHPTSSFKYMDMRSCVCQREGEDEEEDEGEVFWISKLRISLEAMFTGLYLFLNKKDNQLQMDYY